MSLPPFSPEWISDYADSVLDPEALRVEVDTFMEAYDKRIAEVGPWGRPCHGCHGWLLGGGAVATYPGHRVQAPVFPAESWAT